MNILKGISIKKSVITAILGVAFTASASANLIVNGDFEADIIGSPLQSWGSNIHLYDGADIDGWNNGSTPGGGDNVELWMVTEDGNTFAELNSHDNTAGQADTGHWWNLSQHFNAVVGQEYRFTFDYKARQSLDELFKVRIDGANSADFFKVFDDHTTDGWSSFDGTFVATKELNLRLNFYSAYSDGSVGNFIDNVSIAAVPEPGSLALLGLGLAGLGFSRRKTKKA